MNNNPTVSIIIPTFKRGIDVLSRALSSAQEQSYRNVEIIVVDDNAKEECKVYRQDNIVFVQKLSSSDSRVKLVLNKKNLGGALSRNEGIRFASGEYITFLDDDDYFLRDKVLHQLNYMSLNDVNFSFTDLYLYNSNNRVVDIRDRSDIKSFEKEYLLKYHLVKNITGTETFMATKSLLENVGFFDDCLVGHEFYLMLKILLSKESRIGYYKSNDIVAYRTKESSISNGPHKIQGEQAIYSKKKEFFNILSKRERRLVRCRHRLVLCISYLRRKNRIKGLLYFLSAFSTSPVMITKALFSKRI